MTALDTRHPAGPDRGRTAAPARVEGAVGHITLHRFSTPPGPTPQMIAQWCAALSDWEHDPRITAVLIDAPTYETADDASMALPHCDALRLVASIRRYPKPCIALIDGVVTGSGVDVCIFSTIRVVTERARLTLSDSMIDDPTAAATLTRVGDESGTHSGLTSAAVGAGEAIVVGFADHYLPHHRIDALRAALVENQFDEPGDVVRAFTEPPPPPTAR